MSNIIIATVTYLASPEEVATQRPAHRAFLSGLFEKGILFISGPMTSGKGGVLIAKGIVTEQELAQILSHDPFVTSGVGRYEFCEFNPVKLATFLEGHI